MGDVDPLVRISCKDNPNLKVAIRNGKVVLARADPEDATQLWQKDYFVTGNVTDDEGQRAFVLVNNGTGQAMVNKHKPREDGNIEVQLAIFNGETQLSMMWTEEGKDHGGGWRRVRVLRDITMALDGLFGHVKEGTVLGIYHSVEHVGANALWKMETVKTESDIV